MAPVISAPNACVQVDLKIQAAAGTAGVTYVPAYGAFGGNELCQPDPFLFHASAPPVTSFHPASEGQAAFAGLVEKALSTSSGD